MQVVEVKVTNPSGMHLRPGALFIQTAGRFQSRITVENLTTGAEPADARSVTAILGAGIRQGHLIRITADGPDEKSAATELRALVVSGLGEPAEAEAALGAEAGPRAEAVSPKRSGRAAGLPGAPGVAVGPVWLWQPDMASSLPAGTGAEEPVAAVERAANQAAAQLEALGKALLRQDRREEASIVESQIALAFDPELTSRATALVRGGESPETAVRMAADEVASRLAAGPALPARAADVIDVGSRIVRILTGEGVAIPSVPSIAIADDLPPSVVAEMPVGSLLGFAMEKGSATSHAAIIARGMRIPAVVGVAGLVASAAASATVAIDGSTGEVVLDPDEATRAGFERRAEDLARRRLEQGRSRARPVSGADGRRVRLLANIASPEDAARAVEAGAEGVGLFRTEFLFMKRRSAPTEDEQVLAYRSVFEAFGSDRPIVIRLADMGGDKSMPFLGPASVAAAGREAPIADRDRELQLTQLRAIWRAAGLAGAIPRAMAPMVATLEDATTLIELRDEARAALARAGGTAQAGGAATDPLPDRMVTGVMIETPSAVMIADQLARLVDFFSIGTNDLTRFALGADRASPTGGRIQDGLDPAVLRLIARTVSAAHQAGIPVAVCGELAGDPVGAIVLVALGVDELSAEAASLDGMRTAISSVSEGLLAELARQAIDARDAEAVRAMVPELLRTDDR